MNDINILIADDHKVVRSGIKFMLKNHPKYNFKIDEVENGAEAIDKASRAAYDIIIMDIKMPEIDGIQAAREIIFLNKEAKILALSMFDDEGNIRKMIKAGAKGYILKNTGTEELINAIITIIKGGIYYSSEAAIQLIGEHHDELINQESPAPAPAPAPTHIFHNGILSQRELEILNLITNEYTNEEIADKLFLSKRTVDAHRQSIIIKFGVKNTAGIIKYAIKHNML